ncbi:MAG: HD domain-containing protein, partial [Bacteroidales bacterium]
ADKRLWSHDLSHHRRVWEYARELLQNIGPEEINTNNLFIEKLIIACYLHDIGMSVDTGERHGRHSRKLCEQFLAENDLNPSDYTDVLDAIENHDNKDYTDSPVNDRLLMLLSVADDLDAFGYIGIYRYIEIYLARGIQPDKIGSIIRDNAARRFRNFESIFGRFPELISKHRIKFLVLDNFFKEFNSETRNI